MTGKRSLTIRSRSPTTDGGFRPRTTSTASGQWRARRHGIAGIHGTYGIVESATTESKGRERVRIPPLSANHTSGVAAPCAYLAERRFRSRPYWHSPLDYLSIGRPGGQRESGGCGSSNEHHRLDTSRTVQRQHPDAPPSAHRHHYFTDVSGGGKYDSYGGRKSDSRQHGLAAG